LLPAAVAVTLAVTLAACGSSGGGFSGKSGGSGKLTGKTTGASLQLMFGSSGDAETNSLKAAVDAWGTKTGNKVKLLPAANFAQQLTQAMAGGAPPDLFYGTPAQFQSLVKSQSLAATGADVTDPSDFYPNLVKAFTVGKTYYCAPKDFSTLAIEINTDMWHKAGLTDADLPTTWDKLEAAAKKLTGSGVAGLVLQDTLDRVGAFMAEAGGSYMNPAGTQFTFDSPQNLQGLQYVQKLAKEGVLKFPKQVNAGWGGEALGKDKAAMAIEGNWLVGAMKTDYPKLNYRVVPMPTGPTGKQGTLSFTNCWGVAAKSSNQAAAVSLINYLTTDTQQLTFASTIGVMPSRQSAKAQFIAQNPAQQAFIDEAGYAVPQVTTPGFAQVQAQFDSQVINLGSSSDPKTMLAQLQKNADALPK
ncbi:MAG: extracellular solute-binding protein, partial [Jatrophihabitantaceae bacterium]